MKAGVGVRLLAASLVHHSVGASKVANGTCTTAVPTVLVGGDLPVRRLITGLWQTSGGWGPKVSDAEATKALHAMVASGYTTFDGADHYGPAETLMGALFTESNQSQALVLMTKWCPSPERITRAAADAAVSKSMRRMHVQKLDVLQLHWWDYSMESEMLSCLDHLDAIRKEGKINKLGLTNFDTARLKMFLDRGIPIATNQVQFSLIDTRPRAKMAPLCVERGVGLLTYGTLLGGLLSDEWLGKPDPSSDRRTLSSLTPSQGKYYRMLGPWGGWGLFQELLRVLRTVADGQSARLGGGEPIEIAHIGLKWVLDQPGVASVIVGLRAGLSEHARDNLRAFDVRLSAQDLEAIDAVLAKSGDLMAAIGDCGDEYRR